MAVMPAAPLYGRDGELAAIASLLDSAVDHGRAMLIRGETGIGKSALLRAADELALSQDFLVLRASGIQVEARLECAGLHQLLMPRFDQAKDLPPRQHDALAAAFGVAEAVTPNVLLIGLATLGLLSDAANSSPIAILIDDAHWLDETTLQVLAFVARRLESDPVVMLIALRDQTVSTLEQLGLEELNLDGLDDAAAGALLDAQSPGIPRAARRGLLDQAAGNPLAVLELSRLSDELGHMPLRSQWLPLSWRLERIFANRVRDLPPATRAALCVAAVNESDALDEILIAGRQMTGKPLSIDALTRAQDDGLVVVDERAMRFRHPLVRSAVYQLAGPGERQAANQALAAILTHDPERAVWHRAWAALGPDEALASELEATAAHSLRRRGVLAAASALERAAQLTPDGERRGVRLVRAAELAFELGRRDVVLQLLDEAEPLALPELERGRARWLRERFEEGLWSEPARIESLIELADDMSRAGDPDRALDALVTVGWMCWWSNPPFEIRHRVIQATERIAVKDDDPKLIATLAFAAPIERGAFVVGKLAHLPNPSAIEPEEARLLGTAATAIGDIEHSAALSAIASDGLRHQGRLALLARALISESWAGIHTGSWDLTIARIDEGRRLAQETAQPRWAASADLIESIIVGQRGDEQRTIKLCASVEEVLLPTGATAMMSLIELARGSCILSAGRHTEALGHLGRIFEATDAAFHPMLRCWALVDYIEAAVQSNHRQDAMGTFEDMRKLAEITQSPLAQVFVACATPLIADDHSIEMHYQTALGQLARWPFLRARTLLNYGTWLRRQRRGIDARGPLRTARETFDALRAQQWSERAARELRATGEAGRRQTVTADNNLTPQELQIASMAAEGLSNREIGDRLFLSHRTVGSHLYRIFPKLDITSRNELRDALPNTNPP